MYNKVTHPPPPSVLQEVLQCFSLQNIVIIPDCAAVTILHLDVESIVQGGSTNVEGSGDCK